MMLPLEVLHGIGLDIKRGSDNCFGSSIKSFPITMRSGNDLTTRFEVEGDEREGLSVGLKTLDRSYYLNTCKSTVRVTLPPLEPLGEDYDSEITSYSFLAALKEEEPGIKDPEALHRNCYEAMNVLRANRVLDKYVLNKDEAAVVCAIPMLLENEDFSIQGIQGMVESCEKKAPSKLLIMMLTTLRKLPRHRGLIYFEEHKSETEGEEILERTKGEILHPSFCVASKTMVTEKKGTKTNSHREVFRVEDGWGYDISDFALKKDERGCYGKQTQQH